MAGMLNPYEAPITADLSDPRQLGSDVESRLAFLERRAAWHHGVLWVVLAFFFVAVMFALLFGVNIGRGLPPESSGNATDGTGNNRAWNVSQDRNAGTEVHAWCLLLAQHEAIPVL